LSLMPGYRRRGGARRSRSRTAYAGGTSEKCRRGWFPWRPARGGGRCVVRGGWWSCAGHETRGAERGKTDGEQASPRNIRARCFPGTSAHIFSQLCCVSRGRCRHICFSHYPPRSCCRFVGSSNNSYPSWPSSLPLSHDAGNQQKGSILGELLERAIQFLGKSRLSSDSHLQISRRPALFADKSRCACATFPNRDVDNRR